jgi:uncharacterized protein
MKTRHLPHYIDVIQLAAKNMHLTGKLKLVDMSRLVKSLPPQKEQTSVDVNLVFGKDEQGLYYMQGDWQVDLSLICQRCMQPMNYLLQEKLSLSPVINDVEAKNLPMYYDPLLVTEEHVALLTTIEDELLLNLPLVTLHDAKDCEVKLPEKYKQEDIVQTQKPNPFAVLNKLKH